MADPIQDTVDFVYLVLIGVAVYFVYKIYTEGTGFINNMFGVTQGAGSYSNAASQVVTHPIDSLGSIIGLGSGTTTGQTVAGTLMTIAGQPYRCNGTSCYPIVVDANGNETVSGPPVPQVGLFPDPSTIGTM